MRDGDNIIKFPDHDERVDRRWREAMEHADRRQAFIRARIAGLCGEVVLRHDDMCLMEVETLMIEVIGELKGRAFAAGIAEKVAARLRREDGESGAA